MKRLCIYVTYDSENIVDDYIGYMLHDLRKIVDYLVVVCNYMYVAHGLDNLQLYADKIFYRENRGLDAGAYRDVLCQYLGWDVICRYDELLLANDSFFGPFYPLKDLFEKMGQINTDYWGMTSCPETELADGHTYESHIQSYFLLFRNRILQNKDFRKFWEQMAYPVSFTQTVVMFEIGISNLLRQCGFAGITVMDQFPDLWKLDKNDNPHMLYPLELIRDAGIPVLKRKSLTLANRGFGDALGALKFIKNACGYDVHLIENHLRRTGKDTIFFKIDRFCAGHSRLFIYGAGLYGKNLATYFAYKGWFFEKYLVTNPKDKSEDCISFDEADISENDGIIIAVGSKKVFLEILHLVETRCQKEQIFNPEDIIY